MPVRAGYNKQQPYPLRNINQVTGADIHYTASPASTTVLSVANYQIGPTSHVEFPAIAYHMYVDGEGKVYWLHDLDRRVWHNEANNERAIGICYAGDHAPNAAQKAGIKRALQWANQKLGRTLTVRGHKDTSSTACPGPLWPSWKNDILV